MNRKLLLALISLSISFAAEARLRGGVEQNKGQFGKETKVDAFSGEGKAFTGYREYSVNSNWKMTGYFVNGSARSLHLSQKDKSTLNRNEVRVWANKMFLPGDRGVYHRKSVRPGAETYFFNNGLVSYEYNIRGKKVKGYKGVKVLLYEGSKTYRQINTKAYI